MDKLARAPMSHADPCEWWFGGDDLLELDVNDQAEWKEHPFDALDPGDGLTLYRRNGAGQIDHRDAAALLTTFACSEAFRLTSLWNAPRIVAEYLRTSDLRLSEEA